MEFKDRLLQACVNNPNLPRYGEGASFPYRQKDECVETSRGQVVFCESLPRYGNIVILSKLLDVDLNWLAVGDPVQTEQEFQLLETPDNAGLHAFASFLVSEGCTFSYR